MSFISKNRMPGPSPPYRHPDFMRLMGESHRKSAGSASKPEHGMGGGAELGGQILPQKAGGPAPQVHLNLEGIGSGGKGGSGEQQPTPGTRDT